MLDQTFDLASRNVTAEEFDGEFVVLDLATGRYFSIGGAAGAVWQALSEGHKPAALVALLPEGDERRAGLERLVVELVDHGLIKPVERSPTSDAAAAVSRLMDMEPTFTVEVFADLADLLVADPIHDVDREAGWPHMPSKDDQ